MKNTIKFLSILLITIVFISCDDDNDPTNNATATCNNNYVSDLITDVFSVANGYDDLETMDLEIHTYQIRIYADGEICSIGYQNPSSYTGSYYMEVLNNGSATMYQGNHTFSQTQLDYQSITPVTVVSGDLITVVRTIPANTPSNQTVGRVLRKSDFTDVPFPITQDNVEFISSYFQTPIGNSFSSNTAMPYIGLGFKVN